MKASRSVKETLSMARKKAAEIDAFDEEKKRGRLNQRLRLTNMISFLTSLTSSQKVELDTDDWLTLTY